MFPRAIMNRAVRPCLRIDGAIILFSLLMAVANSTMVSCLLFSYLG